LGSSFLSASAKPEGSASGFAAPPSSLTSAAGAGLSSTATFGSVALTLGALGALAAPFVPLAAFVVLGAFSVLAFASVFPSGFSVFPSVFSGFVTLGALVVALVALFLGLTAFSGAATAVAVVGSTTTALTSVDVSVDFFASVDFCFVADISSYSIWE